MQIAAILAVVALAFLALRCATPRLAGETTRHRVLATTAPIAVVRLSCLAVLLARTWTGRSSYADVLLVLPLFPEGLAFDALGVKFGPSLSLVQGAWAAAFAATLLAGSLLAACALESGSARIRRLTGIDQPAVGDTPRGDR